VTGWSAALLAATALHAGFQATVTVLVYPALARVRPEDWAAGHGAHSRAITPLVAVVYAAVLVACTGTVLSSPSSAGAWVAAAATAGAFLVTAAAAAPTHGRLGRERSTLLVARLLAVDRWRLGLAVLALGGAVVHAVRV
jgi:hypothetical protein